VSKVYYIHTDDLFQATNSGENGVVLKKDYDRMVEGLGIRIHDLHNEYETK
jgi:hypothetical protein